MDARAVFAPELFRDQVALVTGGGTGIGFQIARELGHLGAAVVIAARSRERLERATADLREEGIAARWQTVNIRKEDEVSALFDALAAQESCLTSWSITRADSSCRRRLTSRPGAFARSSTST